MKSIRQRLGRLRRHAGRSATMIRWLGLSQAEPGDEPGLLLIQIDGLAREQFERAVRRGRMPFVGKLIKKEGYRLHRMYSGLPSTTPAVQAELFYGVRCAVPAFSFRDPESDQVVRMVDSEPAAATEAKLDSQEDGLLASGSAYTNIYSGGAAEPHFCAATMGWNGMFDKATPLKWVGIVLLNWMSVLRTFLLMFVELGVGLYDAVLGRLAGQHLISELNLIPSRVAVGVGLRELATIGASMDVTRGLKVVQLNFLAYDEQAHRRGPSSRFAHWSLKGIDRAIRRLYKAAQSSDRRNYQVWIYSDHGQERVTPYEKRFGRTIHEAVDEAFGKSAGEQTKANRKAEISNAGSRRQWIRGRKKTTRGEKLSPEREEDEASKPAVEVIAIGPIGHVYVAEDIDSDELDCIAEHLVESAGIPAVLRLTSDQRVTAWTSEGRFALPNDIAKVVGSDHPFLSELADDLECLCRHEAAGKLILCGWMPDGENISFVEENGAHGGPGTAETDAFVLVPAATRLTTPARGFLRPEDFRDAALAEMDARRDTPVAGLAPA